MNALEFGLDYCTYCGYEIDPDTCWCGDSMESPHRDNHMAIPMGCRCGYAEPDYKALADNLRQRWKEAVAELRKYTDRDE